MKRVALAIALTLGAACGGGAADPVFSTKDGVTSTTQSLVDYCVERTAALGKKYDLPLADDPAADCAKDMAEQGITTKGQLDVILGQFEEYVRAMQEGSTR